MSIVKMKKIRLTSVRTQKDDVLKTLMLLNCVEISEPETLPADPSLALIVRRETSALEKHRADSALIHSALDVLKHYCPVKSSMFAPRPDISVGAFLNGGDLGVCLSEAEQLVTIDSRIKRLAALKAREAAEIESLLPWKSLPLPLDTDGTGSAGVLLGAFPPAADLRELNRALQTAVPEAELLEVSADKNQLCVMIVYLRRKQAAVDEALRAVEFSGSAVKSLHGTAEEQIGKAQARLSALQGEETDLKQLIVDKSSRRADLMRAYDFIETQIARAEAAERLMSTESTVSLTGWMPASSEKKLAQALDGYACVWELSDPVPEESGRVPVKLKNNPLTSPLMMVTEMYSLPAYDGVDPNPLMAPFFVLFYGLMMSDVGYGLVMLLAALLVKRKKPRGGMKTFFNLLLMCGISTFVFGFATGSFFGDALQNIAALLGGTFTLPYKPLYNPLTNTQEVLIGAMALGAVQIITGMAISFVMKIRDGHVLDAIFDVGSWWVLFAGIALGALGITWWVAIVGAAALVLTQGRASQSIFGKLAGGIGSLYNITGYFGDILSYSRVMALMLAGGVIAQVFNTIAALTGNIFAFIPIFLIGHALNLGLNLLGCYVHDLRLQCLEFFGKFYKDGGRAFQPLGMNTKYINIVDND
jgi:V/A-type H+-transporting ATPase subunit I